jgi:tRNA(fMet)-specific endonuclease VapC
LYLLDTNILSELLRKRTAIGFARQFHEHRNTPLGTSCVCVMELRLGARRRNDGGALWRRIERQVLPRVLILGLGLEDAIIAGDLFADLFRRGLPMETADVLIAATAIRRRLVLVTHNVKHFGRIPNLTIEDWLA